MTTNWWIFIAWYSLIFLGAASTFCRLEYQDRKVGGVSEFPYFAFVLAASAWPLLLVLLIFFAGRDAYKAFTAERPLPHRVLYQLYQAAPRSHPFISVTVNAKRTR